MTRQPEGDAPLLRAAAGGRLDTLYFENSFARLPPVFYTRLAPAELPDPYLVAVSEDAGALIGLSTEQLCGPQFVQTFAGNAPLAGSEPLAAVYSGHQFGDWAGQLGDGRAHLLGEVRGPRESWEIQLKGSGPTPYSRFADGRAVLRSSIREFLCSEAMAALGIATTRALCVIGSDLAVHRETPETAAVVTRLAPSFLRFGSFEHWSAIDRTVEVRQLADYVIDRFHPRLRDAPHPYEALLRETARRTGELMAHWQAVGFMHGVMNTDNMSLLGLTLDYGPFGFMEAFDAGRICNHSDHTGRYAFRAQPRIAHWNLYALADALLSLIGNPELSKAAVDEEFCAAFDATFSNLMHAKLGLVTVQAGDDALIAELFGLLQRNRADYTLFLRALSRLPKAPSGARREQVDAAVRDLCMDRDACDAWLLAWRARLAREGSDEAARRTRMLACNPRYVLRNWMAEGAIRRAGERDFSEVARVLQCLRRPYEEQADFEHYAAAPPDWAERLSVSCSS